jgi:glutamate formiminotransferase
MCQSGAVLECVINISEGRNIDAIRQLAAVCDDDLLDVHFDPEHNRSVFTLTGVVAPQRLTKLAVQLLQLDMHQGVHPRLGVVDVVPFIALDESTMHDAILARDEFAHWASSELSVPCFVYGAERTLPDIRRQAWTNLQPQCGPDVPHSTAGAVCVGARNQLVAYNVWLDIKTSEKDARSIAQSVRGDGIRTLALQVGNHWQISMNLIDPNRVGPDVATDRVHHFAQQHNTEIDHCELVGLISQYALKKISQQRWVELDLSTERTIEFRRNHGYTFAA